MLKIIQIAAFAATNLVTPATLPEGPTDRMSDIPASEAHILNNKNNYLLDKNLTITTRAVEQNPVITYSGRSLDRQEYKLIKNKFYLAKSEKKDESLDSETKSNQERYVNIIYGLIMPHMHIPASSKQNPTPEKGKIAFYIDDAGNVTHAAVYQSSGNSELDEAALAAVKKAAPLPPLPKNTPNSLIFSYATRDKATDTGPSKNNPSSDADKNQNTVGASDNKTSENNKQSAFGTDKTDNPPKIKSSSDSIYSEFVFKILNDNFLKKYNSKNIKNTDKLNNGKISFSISNDGGLVNYHIDQSTGSPEIDTLAVNSLKESVPFPPPPVGLNKSFTFNFSLPEKSKRSWGSKLTDIDKDCVYHAESTQKADEDFSRRECVAFGGYGLFIEGANLHYSPALEFNGKLVHSHSEEAIHTTGSQKIEWIYEKISESDGMGEVRWKGLIYTLSIAQNNNEKDSIKKFALRLNGAKSCYLGEVQDLDDALNKIKDEKSPCIYLGKK